MKNFVVTLAMILTAGILSYLAFYTFVGEDPVLRRAARDRDTMGWLQSEFHLNKSQYAAIKELKTEYLQQCAGQVEAINAARHRHDSPGELAGLEADAVRSMKAHFQKVSLKMSPEDGQHYLEVMIPLVDSDAQR